MPIRYLTIRDGSATETIMVSESSLRAWSMCNRRRSEWRLVMNLSLSSAKHSKAIVAKTLWGSKALP